MRPKAHSRVSACKAGIRGIVDQVWSGVHDRPSDRILQVTVGAGRAGQAGKAFLVFGDGTLTACKPISDDDLAAYIADCLEEQGRRNSVLAIGGPGDAITPRQQGEYLFALLNCTPRFRKVPIALLNGVIGMLATLGRGVPALARKAELARIGRYYATESMLVLNPQTGLYDAQLTPSTGTETLFDFYARLVKGASAPARGDHAVF